MSNCNIPKDLIEVKLSYRSSTKFDHSGYAFKEGNTDFTLILIPEKDEPIIFDEAFQIIQIDQQTGINYEVVSDLYEFDIVTGKITILDNRFLIQKEGNYSLVIKCSDCNISYEAEYYVEKSGISCDDLIELPEANTEWNGDMIPLDEDRSQTITNKIDEMQSQIDSIETGDVNLDEYRKSVDQDIIDQDLQSQINGINIDKADQTSLDVTNQHVSENTLAIINLETQFALLPNFEEFLTEEEDPIFNNWLSTFDFGQFINKKATLLDDFKNLTLESGYYYTDEDTLNDTSGGNISNAELIVSPTLRTWIGIDKWNGVYIRSYIIETGTWNPWRQLLSTKDIEGLENRVADLENDYSLSTLTGDAVASIPVTPSPISFSDSNLIHNNDGISIISPTQLSILKNGIWEAQIKTNVMKSGAGTEGAYLLGIGLDGIVAKGAWQQVQVSELGSIDDASAVNRFIGYLSVGTTLEFIHYDNGDGGLSLIDTTTNYPIIVTLNLLKGGDL